MVLKNQYKSVFYINNYIDCYQFIQLYDSDQMKKDIKNMDAIRHKVELGLTRAIHQKLEVDRKKRQKREEMVEKWKTKVMCAKRQRARGEIRLFSEDKKNYKSDTRDETNLNQSGNDNYEQC